MPKVTAQYSSRFKKSFKKLDPQMQRKARRKLELFLKDPFSPRLDTHKLKGQLKGYWSLSITDNYRVLFEFLDNQESIGLIDVGTHEIYR